MQSLFFLNLHDILSRNQVKNQFYQTKCTEVLYVTYEPTLFACNVFFSTINDKESRSDISEKLSADFEFHLLATGPVQYCAISTPLRVGLYNPAAISAL